MQQTRASARAGARKDYNSLSRYGTCVHVSGLAARTTRQLSVHRLCFPLCQVISLHFFAGEPVLMSSGGDNAVKQWIFDGEDGGAQLLRFRSGHAAPPVVVRFYGYVRAAVAAALLLHVC